MREPSGFQRVPFYSGGLHYKGFGGKRGELDPAGGIQFSGNVLLPGAPRSRLKVFRAGLMFLLELCTERVNLRILGCEVPS